MTGSLTNLSSILVLQLVLSFTLPLSSFRIVSWNILADLYAPPSKYPWCHPTQLDWRFRKTQIVNQLLQEDADIICLQEIQLDCWKEDLYEPLLQAQADYHCIVQNVTRGHEVANAILFRPSQWKCTAVESRSRVLIAVLTMTNSTTNKRIYLANVHLEAGMESQQDEIRLCQLQSLMKRLDKHILENDDNDDPAIVIIGDWNMRSDNPMYQLMSTGRLSDPIGDDNTKDVPVPTQTTNTIDKLVQQKQQKSHLRLPLPRLPLRDAYQVSRHRRHQITHTYASGCVLDYLWVSNSVEVEEVWSSQKDLHDADDSGARSRRNTHTRKRTTGTGTGTRRQRHFWPNQEHPSDHLAIGATLELR